MTRVFVDTWFFVALLDWKDQDHGRARRARDRFRSAVFVTHNGVLTEVLAFFSGAGSQARTRAAAAARLAPFEMTLVHIDEGRFLRALDLYERRPDKEYSLVDCMSMQLMWDRGITHVLTNDHHFRQEGFTVVCE